jgi:FHS family L-fucose permease-like MFS transporter
VVCFAYLAFFAFAVRGILRKQGVDYDSQVEEANPLVEMEPAG